MYTNVYNCIQMYTNVYKCIQMYTNVYKCKEANQIILLSNDR